MEAEYLEKSRREWFLRELSNLTSGLRGRVSIKDVCVDGDPATEIVKFAETSNTSLIVEATHGHGPFRRFLLGSVTAKVLHDANCAVLTGAHMENALAPDAATGDIRAVLCAVDFGPQTEAALEWSSWMAAAYGARLALLHVLAPAHDPERQRIECEEARQRLESRRALLNADAECHVAVGGVAEEIGNTVRRTQTDLLVIGRGHMAGGGRLRSTSYAVLRESPCPVVSV